PYQVEGCFGIFVHFAIHDHVETTDRLVNGNQHPFEAGELFSHVEGLGQEALHFTGAGNGHLIFVAQLVQTEDGDDVLQFFITLEDQLHAVGSIVVRVAYDLRREDTAGGVQGIHGRIDTKVGNLSAQYGGRIQVGEGRCGSGIGQVIRRHIYRLDGGNGTVLGRSDTFLHETH